MIRSGTENVTGKNTKIFTVSTYRSEKDEKAEKHMGRMTIRG